MTSFLQFVSIIFSSFNHREPNNSSLLENNHRFIPPAVFITTTQQCGFKMHQAQLRFLLCTGLPHGLADFESNIAISIPATVLQKPTRGNSQAVLVQCRPFDLALERRGLHMRDERCNAPKKLVAHRAAHTSGLVCRGAQMTHEEIGLFKGSPIDISFQSSRREELPTNIPRRDSRTRHENCTGL